MDRRTITQRPSRSAIGFQRWSDLTFLHWRVEAAALRPLVPASLEIDEHEGDAFVGLVPFTMRGVRPWWSPAMPWLSKFHETNVRTYVHREGRDPGVWFFSLEAARWIAVQIARRFWNLPYFHARMDLRRDGQRVEYRSERRAPSAVGAAFTDLEVRVGDRAPHAAVEGSLEFFLAERYLLYCTRNDGTLLCGRVWHTPYPLQGACVERCHETLVRAAGLEVPATPDHVLFSPGVSVEVFPLERVPVGS